MAVSERSYGTAAQVAALTRRVTKAGVFDATTNPTLTTVEGWIDQVSAMVNMSLAASGFSIPVSQADAAKALAAVVVEAVADLTLSANSAGRFYTEKALERGLSPLRVIRTEIAQWVEDQAAGLAALGAVRATPDAGQVAYRDTNEAGETSFPLFQRDAYNPGFKDWDT